MKFTLAIALFPLLALAAPKPQNDNRPVATGACCVAGTRLKQDVCNFNGLTGRCVPDNINNCEFDFFMEEPGSGLVLDRRRAVDMH
ncbi:hypothetical protein BU23DRAFT_555511 [Bimuria novae-zelandiae CBS 107.79]|uniref:Extracellular membrane protein CFEM domain-containing protein n=1 Tax=Bimuria novae-zelandiae CBS 107.79 TaxID=1447943 RepID=A0A6A5V4M7_9PLEO|nr:hypothetical protein BU23DRAFT_555511 [Bimuria novae-zelandiae CBS 107.79]